jgi:hypothetical protein
MTRRRQTRRRRRTERREGGPAVTDSHVSVTPEAQAAPNASFRDISYTGLAGGLTGVIALGQSGVFYLLGEADESQWWSIPLFVGAAVYLPAIWVSVRPVPNRRSVLRGVLAITLVLMVVGAVLFDPAIFGLLLIPSGLLAIAAGLLLQRGE